ncbi:methylaspartate mutase subunit E [Desulforamulus ruminis]|uniref:Glutamate mutase epsilon subunit n=1 Tax=Desulforamulus ruminis (strain ATCC 23193 / DSM 2154 / NCIMB 8452 / DL) TaxID=696281 RepID=F6DJY8_DESRL|nr:methylaspartate mutase subunit E [Desulforamulus ruminis]AEG59202.1 methylaspartate mutase, E subunit [Desulforamulus ruminis DSM 2154]
MSLANKKLDWNQFLEIRREVLKAWPTGQEVDLAEAIQYQSRIPAQRRFAEKMEEAKKERITLAQPRAGVALVHEHSELLQYLADQGEADLLPTTIDSYTRQNRYNEAQVGIEESRSVGRSMLNGFPAVNHGVTACRQVVESVKLPLQVRHGTPDARLLAEITLAGGFTAYEGGGISYNIPYAKEVPLERSIRDWQYVDRLVGYYEEQGVSINREPFGPLTGTLVPPCISHSIAIVEALLAAEQGVKSLTLGYGQCGNLLQDVAAVRSLEELAGEYLSRFGYNNAVITTVFHQWMGGFPQDESKAFGVIGWGAATAVLAKATKVIVKTPHEALGIPTKEANAAGIRTTKQVLNMLKDQPLVESKELMEEKDLIKAETRAILEKILEFGEGDVAQGIIRAFQAGTIDVPFAPSRFNAGRLLPARDHQGAVRLLDFGNLPFGEEIKEIHREKIVQRGKTEGRDPSFQMVVDDIYAIGKGMLVGKPR